MLEWMKTSFGNINSRVFVDSAPVLERDWARRSGLGWMGKNTMIIHPKKEVGFSWQRSSPTWKWYMISSSPIIVVLVPGV